MARNEEKSQSMLYRFREVQAAEMGLVGRTDRRPRVASACKDLRQCERWRGEILRDISRKVSKIQDANLTDYEVRDLNDEINKMLREKNHWENQIIALGGANYKRAAKMMDKDGSEVPGARGYKYFGRARELPGVKELFENAANETAELESFKTQQASIFANQGAAYYGNDDDQDEELLAAEAAATAEEWDEALDRLTEDLSLEIERVPVPTMRYISLDPNEAPTEEAAAEAEPEPEEPATKGKRKAAGAKGANKKAKVAEPEKKAAAAPPSKNAFLSYLNEADMRPPKLLTAKEIEAVLVAEQKKVLLEEYGV